MGRATEMCVCVCVGEMCCTSWYLQMQAVVDDTFHGCWPFHGRPTYRINIHERDLAPATFSSPRTGAGGDAMKCTGNWLRKNRVQDGKKNVQLLHGSSLIFLVCKWWNSVHGTTNWKDCPALLSVLFFSNHTCKRCDTVLRKQAWRGGWFCTGTFFCCLQRAEWTTKSKPTPRTLHVCEPPKDWAKDKLLDCEVFGLPQSWLEIFGIGTWKFWWFRWSRWPFKCISCISMFRGSNPVLLHNHWSCP